MKEKRYYLIDCNETEIESPLADLSDDEFMTEAENQGNVYTESSFIDAFNDESVSCFILYLRVIEVEIP